MNHSIILIIDSRRNYSIDGQNADATFVRTASMAIAAEGNHRRTPQGDMEFSVSTHLQICFISKINAQCLATRYRIVVHVYNTPFLCLRTSTVIVTWKYIFDYNKLISTAHVHNYVPDDQSDSLSDLHKNRSNLSFHGKLFIFEYLLTTWLSEYFVKCEYISETAESRQLLV